MDRSKYVGQALSQESVISCDGGYEEATIASLPSYVHNGRIPSRGNSLQIDCDDVEYRESMAKMAAQEPDGGVDLQRSSFIDAPPVLEPPPEKPVNLKPMETGPAPDSMSSNGKLALSVMNKIKEKGMGGQLSFKETKMPPEPQLAHVPPKQSGVDLSYDLPNRWPDAKIASDKSIFADPEANPYKIYAALIDLWGDEWLDWEPETILETAEIDGVIIDQVNLGKMFAIRSLLKTEEFFREPRVFEKVCIAFADKIVDFGVLQMPKLYEIAGAVSLVEKKFREGQYSNEVGIFVAMIAVNEGFLLLPPELNFAGEYFNLELISRHGSDIINLQDNVISAMGQSGINEEEAIQYKRLMVCSYYISNMINGAK